MILNFKLSYLRYYPWRWHLCCNWKRCV